MSLIYYGDINDNSYLSVAIEHQDKRQSDRKYEQKPKEMNVGKYLHLVLILLVNLRACQGLVVSPLNVLNVKRTMRGY